MNKRDLLSEQSYTQGALVVVSDLQRVGFSEKEARVYLGLLQLGPSYPAALAKHVGLNRITCYDILGSLVRKELALRVRKNEKLLYRVESVRSIEEYLSRKGRKIEEEKKQYDRMLSCLEAYARQNHHQPTITFYEGKNAIEKFFNDNWSFPGEKVVGYTNLHRLMELVDHHLIREAMKKRRILKIPGKYLIPHGQGEMAEKWRRMFYRRVPVEYQSIFRVSEDRGIAFDNHVKIYGSRIAILDLTGRNEGTGVIIDNERIANTMRNVFLLAWRGALHVSGQ